jgi:hypothetical protein
MIVLLPEELGPVRIVSGANSRFFRLSNLLKFASVNPVIDDQLVEVPAFKAVFFEVAFFEVAFFEVAFFEVAFFEVAFFEVAFFEVAFFEVAFFEVAFFEVAFFEAAVFRTFSPGEGSVLMTIAMIVQLRLK